MRASNQTLRLMTPHRAAGLSVRGAAVLWAHRRPLSPAIRQLWGPGGAGGHSTLPCQDSPQMRPSPSAALPDTNLERSSQAPSPAPHDERRGHLVPGCSATVARSQGTDGPTPPRKPFGTRRRHPGGATGSAARGISAPGADAADFRAAPTRARPRASRGWPHQPTRPTQIDLRSNPRYRSPAPSGTMH